MLKKFQADNELIEKLRGGDVEAFDQVYLRYAGKLHAFSMKYLKSKEEVEELFPDRRFRRIIGTSGQDTKTNNGQKIKDPNIHLSAWDALFLINDENSK